ncbi:hypothetical protein B0H21DRAFT_812231 [Amylocystis lapponica]|nr:hypothetical protein B0H21DRAFT_812231 [Amylocystis lapponica]
MIYRGTLLRDDQKISDVICKVVYTKLKMRRLRHEADLYGKELKTLQRKVVPVCYGLFEGEMKDEEMAGCLVTQYCGKHSAVLRDGMGPKVGFISRIFVVALIRTLVRMHRTGVQHGDFCERNVVFNAAGQPFIIDFDEAQPHVCARTMSIMFHIQEPDPKEFQCTELYEAAQQLGAWTPRLIRFWHWYWPIELAENAQMLADCAPPDADRTLTLREARVALDQHYLTLRRRLDCDWRPVQ